MSYLKYKCLLSHVDTHGRYFRKGNVYLFTSDPGARFSVTADDPRHPVGQGSLDGDKTWYPGYTGWDDLRMNAARAKQGQTNKPDFDYTDIGLLMPQNDPLEIVYISEQFPHEMALGPNAWISPHCHVIQEADQQAVLKYVFRIYENGDAVPAFSSEVTGDEYLFPYTSGTMLQIIEFPEIDISGIDSVSAFYDFKLYRDDNVYTGDLLLKSFDIHIKINSPLGSGQEYIK